MGKRNKSRNWIQEKKYTEQRIHWLAKESIPYLKETISPARKNEESMEIESLKEAMNYYKPYTEYVCIQKKYMGSYCLMVLNEDHSKSYFVTRNGHRIKEDYIPGLHEKSAEIHNKLFYTRPNMKWIVVESELMPWRLLGSNLIDKEYGNYGQLHRDMLNTLKSSESYNKVLELRKEEPWDRLDLKPHEKRQYKSAKNLDIVDLSTYENMIDLYDEQLSIFGADGEIEFKPFNILKCETFDNEIIFPSHQHFPGEFSDFVVLEVDDYKNAYEFFNNCKSNNEEGVMVKPLEQRLINIAPALKVRTNKYLQLIYGVNFNKDYDYYFNKRHTSRKLFSSIKQYESNLMMLSVPIDLIEKAPRIYTDACYVQLDSEKFNKTLDSRL